MAVNCILDIYHYIIGIIISLVYHYIIISLVIHIQFTAMLLISFFIYFNMIMAKLTINIIRTLSICFILIRAGEMTSGGIPGFRDPKVTPYKNGEVIGFDQLFFEKGPV